MDTATGVVRVDTEDQQSPRPRLMRISEVEKNYDPSSPLRCIADWIRGFLARSHPELGRHGSVCPFVPVALELNTIWMTEVAETTASFESISAIITEYRNVFLETEPTRGSEAMNKAFLLVFPSLTANGADGPAIIDKVQVSLKKYFVEMGLMLGEFHAANESPGLRNPDFRPLRSPIPMLAIRHMVESDLPFLTRNFYAPHLRSVFLRSYLFRLGGALSQVKFNEALDVLIAAEVSIASSPDENSTFIVCPV
ncbi:MAG TPA: hypothetical protein VI636_06485 [Candidatus Angelobacter sp.]